MAGLEERREALVDLIYDAVLDQPLWSRVLEGIADLTDSAGGLIHGYSADRDVYTFHDLGRIDPDYKRRHELFHVENPWRRSSVYPAGHLLRSDEMVPLAELKQSAFYADVLAPQNLAHSLTAILAERPDLQISINVERSEAKGPYGEREIALIRPLLPHLRRASEMRLRMRDYQIAAVADRETLNLLACGIIAVDAGGCLLLINEAGTDLAQKLGWRLKRAKPIAGAGKLGSLLQSALHGGPGGWLPPIQGLEPPISIQVLPARGIARQHLCDAVRSQVAALVILTDARSALEGATPLFAQRYDLTAGEMRVVSVLAQGEPLAAAASELGISVNTLKTHAKRIYAKSGTRGRADLIRALIEFLPAPA